MGKKRSSEPRFPPIPKYRASDGQQAFMETRASESLDDVLEALCNLTDRMDIIEATVENITEVAEMNRKRHQNTDYSLGKLCPLMDTIFDTSDAPGHIQYDCCYESHAESGEHVVGQAMFCKLQSALTSSADPDYSVTDRGVCDTTCGELPPN